MITRYVDLTAEQDMRVCEIAFSEGKTRAAVIADIIASGLLSYDASGARTIKNKLDERNRLYVQFRAERIDALVAEFDEAFDQRWEQIKVAIAKVYEDKI